MREPLFAYTKRGLSRQIVPLNAKGWLALVLFILVIIAPAFLLPWLLERSPWLLVPQLAFVLVVTFGFMRWAISRSRRIDLDVSASELAEFREWKRRGKR